MNKMIKQLLKLIKDSRPIRISAGQLRGEGVASLIDEVEDEYYKYGEPEKCEPSEVLSKVREKLGLE